MNNNIINKGLIDTDGDNIFFINCNDKNLYMIDKNRNIKKLSDNKVNYINVKGSWVYYLSYNEKFISRVSIDGNHEEVLYEVESNDIYISHPTVVDNYVLIEVYGGHLKRINLETRKVELISFQQKSNVTSIIMGISSYDVYFSDGYIYFTDDMGKVWRIPEDYLNEPFSSYFFKSMEAYNLTLEKVINTYKEEGYDVNNINDIEALSKSTGKYFIPVFCNDTHKIENIDKVQRFIIDVSVLYCIVKPSNINWDEEYEFHGKLYTVNLQDNSVNNILSDDITALYASGQYITYIDRSKKYRVPMLDSRISKASEIDNVVDICGIGHENYLLLEDNSVMKINLNTFMSSYKINDFRMYFQSKR